jgi:hypothetical protein
MRRLSEFGIFKTINESEEFRNNYLSVSDIEKFINKYTTKFIAELHEPSSAFLKDVVGDLNNIIDKQSDGVVKVSVMNSLIKQYTMMSTQMVGTILYDTIRNVIIDISDLIRDESKPHTLYESSSYEYNYYKFDSLGTVVSFLKLKKEGYSTDFLLGLCTELDDILSQLPKHLIWNQKLSITVDKTSNNIVFHSLHMEDIGLIEAENMFDNISGVQTVSYEYDFKHGHNRKLKRGYNWGVMLRGSVDRDDITYELRSSMQLEFYKPLY